MKKLFILILLAGQTLLAQAQQWHQCLNSYRPASTSLIDIQYGSVGSHDYMIFRNGSHFIAEGLNIFYKGKFWKIGLEVTTGFYEKKIMSVRMGEDRFCLKRDFRWLLSDRSELSEFRESQCGGDAEAITMRENSQELSPTSEEVLAYRLEKDVKFQAECVAGKAAGGCSADHRREDFERLQRWNTEACQPITRLQETINMSVEAIQIFNSTAANTPAP